VDERSKTIDKSLASRRKQLRSEVRLLLLGPGESGKSTVFKQMKIIQGTGGFSAEELQSYKYIVYGNCVSQMKVLIAALQKFEIPLENPANQSRVDRLLKIPAGGDSWSKELAEDIKHLWLDTGIKGAFDKRDDTVHVNDSASYFFDNIDRFMVSNYVPTPDDVLRARVRSTGIEEAEFTVEDVSFRMIDVGGQRSERRKWIHCFEGITAVIFCASLSEYDQKLREDDTQNRMTESLMLFEEMSNSTWFSSVNFILFLNKIDIFREKIKEVPLSTCFPNYTGGADYESGTNFITARFLERNQAPHSVYPHLTCAISTENIQFVFKAIRETILKKVLGEVILL